MTDDVVDGINSDHERPTVTVYVDDIWFDRGSTTDCQRAVLARVSGEAFDPNTSVSVLSYLEALGYHLIEDIPNVDTTGSAREDLLIGIDEGYDLLASFMAFVAPQLQQRGWVVRADLGGNCRLMTDHRWYAKVEDSTNQSGWLQLELGVEVDGERINLLPILLYLINSHENSLSLDALVDAPTSHKAIPIGEGRIVAVRSDRLAKILSTLLELHHLQGLSESALLSLAPSRVPCLMEMVEELESGIETSVCGVESLTRYRALARNDEEVEPPQGLQATLRDYQREGLSWLQSLKYFGGGILADDMGLGKTLQTIANLLLEHSEHRGKPSLVLAPKTLVSNWKKEIAKFAPSLSVLVIQGPSRQKLYSQIPYYDIVISSYPLVVRDDDFFEHRFAWVVLDEAQAIKNPSSRLHNAVCSLDASYRLCLSGTPVENHLGELWALCHFSVPELLGSVSEFDTYFRRPIEKDHSEGRLLALRERVGPVVLRRRKETVAKELPPKTIMIREVEFEQAQRDLYESIRLAAHRSVNKAVAEKGWNGARVDVLSALMRLRQVCCEPALSQVSAGKITDSAKREALGRILLTLKSEGRRALVFSQFTSVIEILQNYLRSLGLRVMSLTGKSRDRGQLVDRFQKGEHDVFLISLMAGGTGLTLTAAATVIHYDPWWNPAIENQATDRAYRIGQDKPVFVYKMIVKGSIEERIVALQQKKTQLAEQLFGEGHRLELEDVEALLAPMS